jgi:hypothetical protein
MFYKRFVVISLTLVLWAGPLLAQEPATPAPGPETDATSVQEKPAANTAKEQQEKVKAQAVVLLREIADEAGRMQLVENRISIQTLVANLMWDADEKASRDLFTFAMADVRSLYTAPADENDEDSAKYKRRMEAGQLRQSLLMTLAVRDPKVARTFLRATHELASTGGNEAYGPYGNDDQLELTLALQIARNDPDQALEMGRQSLAKGFSPQVVSLAQMIYKKNPESAAKLTGETITKLKGVNLAENQEAASLAIMLFQVGAAPVTSSRDKNHKADTFLDEASLRELAEMITTAAMTAGPEDYRLASIGSLLDQLEKYAPSQAKQLRRKMSPLAEGANPNGENWMEFNRIRDQGTVEDLLAAAEKPENATMKPSYYDAAVTKLLAAGEIDRARNLVNEKVTDTDLKHRLSQQVEQGALEQAATKGNLEESRRLLSGVKTNEERVMVLAALATSVGTKDKKAALRLLEEATNMSVPRARTYKQLFARLALVKAYASLDPDQAFSILEGSVDQANELLAAFLLLGEFLGEGEVVRNDEVTIFQLGPSVNSEVSEYRATVNTLAMADFGRMKGVADRFQRPEIRLLARLLVAQSVLSDPADDDPMKGIIRPSGFGPID